MIGSDVEGGERREDGVRYGYMCKADFDYELEEASGGSVIYPSIEDLLEHRKCVRDCGIVRVKVSLADVVLEEREYTEEDFVEEGEE